MLGTEEPVNELLEYLSVSLASRAEIYCRDLEEPRGPVSLSSAQSTPAS
jgi:hypothetical protein